MIATFLRGLGWCCRMGWPWGGLALHFGIVAAYARRWDRAAALTVFPFWAWCGLGVILVLLGWKWQRRRASVFLLVLWLVTLVIGSDETPPLLRWRAQRPVPGVPADDGGRHLLRVISLNCRHMNPVSAEEVLPWHPDVVLLQEAPSHQALALLAQKLYPDGQPTHVLGGYEVAVLTRGEVLPLYTLSVDAGGNIVSPFLMRELPCSIKLDGRMLHVVSVHLQGAVTEVGLHRAAAWQSHYMNRISRREEMRDLRRFLEVRKLYGMAPILIGGDFNAPAGDAVFRELTPDFTDAFAAVGSGWGDTFPNKTPLLRIDHIYASSQLQPVRACTVETANSDHRMVVADFALMP